MRKIWLTTLLATTLLAACSDEGFPEIIEEKKITHHVGETAQISTYASQQYTWNEQIATLATNGEPAADKFRALERFATNYVTNAEELEQFTAAIIADYKAHTYIQNVTQHKDMLTRIFQAFVVERNAMEDLKDFTRAYYSSVTGVYTAQFTTDDEMIQQNEAVMDYALAKHEQ